MQTRDEAVSDDGYRSLGLVGDPFAPSSDSSDPLGVKISTHVAALGLLAAVDDAATSEDRRPVVIAKGQDVPVFYPVTALAEAIRRMTDGEPIPGVMALYIPLDMMRLGRVRAPLSAAAERLSGGRVDLTIAEWMKAALVEPDTDLAEWSELPQLDVQALLAELAEDPAAVCERVFGPLVASREGADDLETLMKVSTARQGRLEVDPDEEKDVSAAEDAGAEDPMGEAFITPLGEVDPEALEEADVADLENESLAAYVVAWLAAHVSPVIARGVRAYKAQGSSSMAQEWKVTKAPTKTLAALLHFGSVRFPLTVIIYDRFEMWPDVPEDMRSDIIATLLRLRWALKDHAVLALMLPPGEVPELEEAFGAGRAVPWTFGELADVESYDSPFDAEIFARWLQIASLDGTVPAWAESVLGGIPEGTTVESAARALSTALTDAAERGASEPNPAVVVTALQEAGDAAPA